MPRTSARRTRSLRPAGVLVLVAVLVGACSGTSPSTGPVSLRLQVSMTPEELATFQPAIQAVDTAHPEFTVQLENVPQDSETQKITTEVAADDLPDVLRVTGLQRPAVDPPRRVPRPDRTGQGGRARPDRLLRRPARPVPLARRPVGHPGQRLPGDRLLRQEGVRRCGARSRRTTRGPYEDMRTAALKLTVDAAGKHPGDAGFDPAKITRWGWNGGVTYYWQDAAIQGLGGELCATPDCTTMSFTDPATRKAFDWWVGLVRDDHAGLCGPVRRVADGGARATRSSRARRRWARTARSPSASSTPPAPSTTTSCQPFLGTDGKRHTPLSTNGYVIAAKSEHPDQAWALIQALVAPAFLEFDLGQARSRRAGPAVRGVVGHRHLAPAGQPEGDPRGDGGRRGVPAVHRRRARRPTTGPSTCSPR